MKIAIFDHLGVHKTTREIEKWFREKGHEVKWNMYYDMREVNDYIGWCDIAVFEWFEGMMERCLKDGWGKKKPIYVRAMDIEIWANNAAGADITDLSGLAYTSKAYFEIFKTNHDLTKWPKLKVKHIPLSIDLRDWTFKKREPGYNIGILGHFWGSKGEVLIPQFAKYLINKTGNKEWKFYLQGEWRHDVWLWYFYYMKHIVKEMGLENNIFFNEKRVNNINEWYDKIDYLVTFSMKDAFSIPVAEAMAKGIKALPHNFLGAKDVWQNYVWSDFDELVDKIINEPYNSQEYHKFIVDNYSNEVVMKLWHEFLKIPIS